MERIIKIFIISSILVSFLATEIETFNILLKKKKFQLFSKNIVATFNWEEITGKELKWSEDITEKYKLVRLIKNGSIATFQGKFEKLIFHA